MSDITQNNIKLYVDSTGKIENTNKKLTPTELSNLFNRKTVEASYEKAEYNPTKRCDEYKIIIKTKNNKNIIFRVDSNMLESLKNAQKLDKQEKKTKNR